MIAASSPSIIPAHLVTQARGAASFTRDFSRDRGSIEIAPGVQQPLVSVSASVVTTKTGTDTQFWALRTSIAVFHAPSGRFITAHEAIRDLPLDERDIARLHYDETWATPATINTSTLATQFRHHIANAAKQAEAVAYAWKADLLGAADAEVSLRRELATITDNFKRAITRTL